MRTINIFKQLLLLCLLFVGTASTQAVDQWTRVTDLSDVQTGDIVVIVDESKEIALPNTGGDFTSVAISLSGGYISSTVSDDVKWTLSKNSKGLKFTRSSDSQILNGNNDLGLYRLGMSSDSYSTSYFHFDSYASGGKLYFETTDPLPVYAYWDDDNKAKVSFQSSDAATLTLYKLVETEPIVKWKKVNDTSVTPSNDDVVVIVDLNTGRAMSNDKADKDPDAIAVDLNDDKDRILGDVAEKLQWTFTKNGGNYKFAVGENNLYANSEALKVGTETTNNEFSFSNNDNGTYMGITIDGTQYYAGVDASMFSNTWKLVTGDDDKAKDTQPAIFKKIADEQIIATIDLAENFAGEKGDVLDLNATCTGANFSEIQWTSSNTDVATVADGVVTLIKRGTVVITASIAETAFHDKASAKCTVRIDDSSLSEPGSSALNPLSVADAKELAEKGEVTVYGKTITLQEGVNYYVKGKVSKVNSGMMAMFGDMDFGSLGGGTGSGGSGMDFDEMMEDMDFDMDSMGDMGFDMSSMGFDMSAFFGSSEGVTYYISDDGTKDNQMKVVNGRGVIASNNDGAVTYDESPNLSPGDCLVVCGPLVYSEDTNMFSSMMGGNNSEEEPKMSAKVDELNYMALFDPTLLVEDKEIYVNRTLDGTKTYSIDNYFDEFSHQMKITEGMEIQEPTFKSSDEEIAKWDEDSKKIIGVSEGTAKITVKVKVIITPDDPNTDDNEEKSYKMKRKFKLTVKTRDLDPAGYYDGDYVLTTSTDNLEEGLRLILVGTRVKDDKQTDYVMGENNSMMGGGKSGSKYEFSDTSKEKIPCEDVPNGTQEVILEKADASSWYLNVGEDENGNKLYLYASVKKEEESGSGSGSGSGGSGSGFNMDEMMEMFNPSSGLKVATMAEATADSCRATITFSDNFATIKFPKVADDKNNTIMLSSAFDMEAMMNMFSSSEGEGEGGEGSGNSFDMGSFDMFMASFNTKKPGDENPEEGKAAKNFMPRIYRFVPDPSFGIKIGNTAWRTIVTYKNVEIPENVDAYIVTKVQPGETNSLAILKSVERLKGGEPYLLHITSGSAEDYTMTLTSDEIEVPAPANNKLMISDRTTTGSDVNSTVFVLANKSNGVGFYRWTGDELGKGRVYLPVAASVSSQAGEFIVFGEETTAIDTSIQDEASQPGSFFNLSGQRISPPSQKGIYITGGKKVVIN